MEAVPETAATLPPPRPWSFHLGDGVEGLIAHGDVDHSFLDPPYDEDVDAGNEAELVRGNSFGFDPMNDELRNRVARAVAMRTRRWALIFCSLEEAFLWRFALVAAGMSYWRTGLWVRQNNKPQMNAMGPAQSLEAIVMAHSRTLTQRWNGGGKDATWFAPIVRGTERMHPTQKPTKLMAELVEDFTDPGELIADPFSGVASTGVAALGLNRRFVGWELNPEHHSNGIKRLEKPLFETPTTAQIELLTGKPGRKKGAAAKARMELDRNVLDAILSSGETGIKPSAVAEIVGSDQKEVQRSFNRLKKSGRVVRHGRTTQTRWHAQTQEQN